MREFSLKILEEIGYSTINNSERVSHLETQFWTCPRVSSILCCLIMSGQDCQRIPVLPFRGGCFHYLPFQSFSTCMSAEVSPVDSFREICFPQSCIRLRSLLFLSRPISSPKNYLYSALVTKASSPQPCPIQVCGGSPHRDSVSPRISIPWLFL